MTLGQSIDQIIEALESLDEQARQTAIDAACAHLGLQTVNTFTPPQPPANPSPENRTPPPADKNNITDIRSLKEQKSPKSASQMACVVAYYLQELAPENERKETVNAKDLEKYFKQAQFKLPKTISQLLPDSKQSGYFDSASGKGEYSLNAVGYNLVAHGLPKTAAK